MTCGRNLVKIPAIMDRTFDLSSILAKDGSIGLRQQLSFAWKLSVPGMMAQLSSILMQYIDAAMVGFLGANASASIGLVASSTWVLGSLQRALVVGFTVQAAHAVGAGEKEKAKNLLFNALIICGIFSLILLFAGVAISFKLPFWLGADAEIYKDAFWYFFIFCLSGPFYEIVYLMGGMQQCSGNMRLPGILNALMCILDIVFNFLFIFIMKLGVKGAALGSASSAIVVAVIFSYLTLVKSETLKFTGWHGASFDRESICKALRLAGPVALESSAFSGALVVVARIIAPLGAVSLAANSFATTAESLCYMPAYGIEEAATTLVGQSYGAKNRKLVYSFSWITVACGIALISLLGIAMYFLCPYVFKFITPDIDIQALSVKVLRIELLAEPFFGASIVATGALRGKGDTLVPSVLNLFSLWVVRLSLSLILVKPFGLVGIWIAMAAELCFRGIVLLSRLAFSKTLF